MIRTSFKAEWGALLAALTLLSVAAPAGHVAADRTPRWKLSHPLRAAAQARRGQMVDVIVRFRSDPGSADRAAVSRLSGRVRRQLRSSRGLAVRMPAHALDALSRNPEVEFVAVDAPVRAALDVARPAAGMPPLGTPEGLLDGAGVTVAVLDSGVSAHPELANLVGEVDLVSSGGVFSDLLRGVLRLGESADANGHGTHVAGIIGGDGSRSTQGRYAGMAPGASVLSVRVLDKDGRGLTSDVIAGVDWVLANKDAHGIRVVNVSLGHPVYEPAAMDPLVQAVERLWDAGVVVVCSAGNAGRNGAGTITSPCNSRKVITVGALNDRNTPAPGDDAVATYSSRGPTRIDLVAKPDLLAPGNRIVSARSPGGLLDTLFPERRVSGAAGLWEHYEMSGTSMAAPAVTGAVALMLQQQPWLNPGTVKLRLMRSAAKVGLGSPFATGAGVLDVEAALRQWGWVENAPSPLVFRDLATGRLGVQNTALLWNADGAFGIRYLWSGAILWPDLTEWDPVLWSEGVLEAGGILWPDVDVDPEANALLWPDSVLWDDSELWDGQAETEGGIEGDTIVTPDP